MISRGSTDLFTQRLGAGIAGLAHHVLHDKRVEFAGRYEPAFSALSTCRQAKVETLRTISDHKQRIAQNKGIRDHAGRIEVVESIDAAVREKTVSFIVNGVSAVKGIQDSLAVLDLDIGYLFQKQSEFYRGIDALYASGRHFLASYLKQVRGFWCEKFINRRNDLEHGGWTLPDLAYKRLKPDKIQAIEPAVDGLPVSDYLIIMSNRIFSFIENVVVYGIKQRIRSNETIEEIPAAERDPQAPFRFRIVPCSEVKMEWDIRYSEDDFCDSPPTP